LISLSALVKEIDTEESETGSSSVEPKIVDLRMGQFAEVDVLFFVDEGRRGYAQALAQIAVESVRELGAGDERPPHLNDYALKHIKSIARASGNGFRSVTLSAPNASIKPATISREYAQRVDRVLPEGYALGSVTGILGSVTVYGRNRFKVFNEAAPGGVDCSFDPEHLSDITKALGKEVKVAGLLRRTLRGRPQSIIANRPFELTVKVDPVDIRRLWGVFRGDVDAADLLKEVRGS
jgi:hypothetical protein